MNDVSKRNARGAFDIDAWRAELLVLNPWTQGLKIDEDFNAARQGATLARFELGTDAWNTWAKTMVALQSRLNAAGRWVAKPSDSWTGYLTEGGNKETSEWLACALAAFSVSDDAETTIGSGNVISFRSFTFPSDAIFDRCLFQNAVDFAEAAFLGSACLDKASFLDDASFVGAQFHGRARFLATKFRRAANFDRARFVKDARFPGAKFEHGARFSATRFDGFADFIAASLHGAWQPSHVNFNSAHFSDDVRFEQARFSGLADFSRAKFDGQVDFNRSTFSGEASFEVVECQAVFSLANASFLEVPSFMGAIVRGPLRLDSVRTPRCPVLGWTRNKDAPARFRELKRRANEAQDRDRELEFFAQEIRTSRFHARGLPAFVPRVWEWRFWFGLLFGTFSDFGRSLWRPALFWAALLVGFSAFYLGEIEDMRSARRTLNPDGVWATLAAYVQTTRGAWSKPPACKPQGRELFASTDALTEAFQLSLRNALVFDGGRSEGSKRTFGCLYGLETAGEQEYTKVSPRVSMASTIQSLASAVLIFLFLLAVRNLLRLK